MVHTIQEFESSACPSQENTGRCGYFGKRGSLEESWQSTKREPRADSMLRECAQFAHNPAFVRRCSGLSLPFMRILAHRYCHQGVDAGWGGAASGVAGLVNSESAIGVFTSILSMTNSWVRSVAELPESIWNANLTPSTSR